MPKFYSVSERRSDTDPSHFRTQEEAFSAARSTSKELDTAVTVTLCTTPPLTLDVLLGILNSNGGGYAETETEVAVARNGRIERLPAAAA